MQSSYLLVFCLMTDDNDDGDDDVTGAEDVSENDDGGDDVTVIDGGDVVPVDGGDVVRVVDSGEKADGRDDVTIVDGVDDFADDVMVIKAEGRCGAGWWRVTCRLVTTVGMILCFRTPPLLDRFLMPRLQLTSFLL